MSDRISLPIDPFLPEITAALRRHGALVLQAEPGAGKTTRVPAALLEAGASNIVVLEPRRIAAKLSAERVAFERGEKPGDSVGYQFRFESVVGPKTRLRFLTEGLLMRRMVEDPELRGVDVVVLDEFHERHLHADLALAALRRLRMTSRPDLKILVMSATLETESLSAYLGSCPVMRVPGRTFEVRVEYLGGSGLSQQPGTGVLGNTRDLDRRVLEAVRKAEASEGDVLVFLPGMSEIRRCESLLDAELDRKVWETAALHGELSKEEQNRALSASSRRKVILATNIAETSITLPSVRTVVDSGLHRQASWSGWSGLPVLRTRAISRASAIQRAGRAGRTAPGVCYRLYSKGEFDSRPPFETPEVLRADLAQAGLELSSLGVAGFRALEWLDSPGPSQIEAAEKLLVSLGAWGADAKITALGRRIARLPLHPRLGRVLLEAERRAVRAAALDVVAWLSEDVDSGEDVIEAWTQRRRELGRDATVTRLRERLERALGPAATSAQPPGATDVAALSQSILAGFPDRVGRRRGKELVLASGGSAQWDGAEHYPAQQEYFVALQVEERQATWEPRSRPRVRSLCPLQEEWLLEVDPSPLQDEDEVLLEGPQGRPVKLSRFRYASLVLSESRTTVTDPDQAARLLARAVAEDAHFLEQEASFQNLQKRLAFLEKHSPASGLSPLQGEVLQEALVQACMGCSTLNEVKAIAWSEVLESCLPQGWSQKLERLAPSTVVLSRGRRVKVNYEAQQAPWIESRLQDFFGMKKGPAVLEGRHPLTLHLLAPNYRAVQVTSDLEGFWQRIYPELRRELGRRYPRHAWPENPLDPGPIPDRR